MKLWIVDTWLLKRYYEIDKRVYLDEHYISKRPHIGVIFKTSSGIEYFAPICSTKDSDYEKDGSVKKSSLGIHRIVSKCGRVQIGRIQIANMIPVSKQFYEPYILSDYFKGGDNSYLKRMSMLDKQIKYVKINREIITREATRFYKMKKAGARQKNIINSVDFIKLEECLKKLI